MELWMLTSESFDIALGTFIRIFQKDDDEDLIEESDANSEDETAEEGDFENEPKEDMKQMEGNSSSHNKNFLQNEIIT